MKVIRDDEIMRYEGRIESNRLISPTDAVLTSKVFARFRGDVDVAGDPLPWQEMGDRFRLRPGEMTVWAGYNGHGKSQLLGHVMGWLMPRKRICIASMEMPLDLLMVRLYRQLSGTSSPSEAHIHRIANCIGDSLYLYNTLDTVTPDRIVALTRYCARHLQLDHMVVDSLIKCGTGVGDKANERQADLIDALQWAVKDTGMHLHVVHHLRKGQSETTPPGKLDIKGAGEIVDLTDNAVLVWKNVPKIEDKTGSKVEEPDCLLKVVKQRHGEWEGSMALHFQKASLQYTGMPNRRMEWRGFENERIEQAAEVGPVGAVEEGSAGHGAVH